MNWYHRPAYLISVSSAQYRHDSRQHLVSNFLIGGSLDLVQLPSKPLPVRAYLLGESCTVKQF
jgi:hypothetical protein